MSMIFPLFNAALIETTAIVYIRAQRLSRIICAQSVNNCALRFAMYISKCLPAIESMACTNGKSVHVRIVRIRGVFPKVPPCGRARFKYFRKNDEMRTSVHRSVHHSFLYACTDYPQHAAMYALCALSANLFSESCALCLATCWRF